MPGGFFSRRIKNVGEAFFSVRALAQILEFCYVCKQTQRAMRFRLTLYPDTKTTGNRIPLNYQYEQAGAIYRVMAAASEEYSAWLHDNGFRLGNKQFRLFCYSQFQIPQYQIDTRRECIEIQSDKLYWYISFLPEHSTEQFIRGIFQNQALEISNGRYTTRFRITGVEVMPPPHFGRQPLTFRTLSPLCIINSDSPGQTQYLSPAAPSAGEAIYNSLVNRYEAFYGKPFDGSREFKFEVIGEPRSKLITFKVGTPEQTRVRGYMCRFRLTADEQLMKVMYESGAGVKGSMGFGMVEMAE